MKGTFYLVKTQSNWYQLRYAPDHSVLGCGTDVQALLNTVRRYVLRFKTKDGMQRAIRRLSYHYRPNEAETIKRQYEYEHQDAELRALVVGTVTHALEEVRQNTPLKQVKKRLLPSKRKVDVPEKPKMTGASDIIPLPKKVGVKKRPLPKKKVRVV